MVYGNELDCRRDEGIQLFKAGVYLVIHESLSFIAFNNGFKLQVCMHIIDYRYFTWQILGMRAISDDLCVHRFIM